MAGISGVWLLLGKWHMLAATNEMEEEISHLRKTCKGIFYSLNLQSALNQVGTGCAERNISELGLGSQIHRQVFFLLSCAVI